MNFFLSSVNRIHLALFCCCLIIASIIYSPFLLSVAMIALGVITIFKIEKSPTVRIGFRKALVDDFRQLLRSPPFLVLSFFFFIVFFSGLYSEDFGDWWDRLRKKIPFLTLPLVFISLPTFSKKQYLGIYYFLILILFFTSIGIGINYCLNFDAITESMLRGQAIPTPRNHIRYSLLMAIGIISGAYLYQKNYHWKYLWERQLILGITIFLFFFIHVLSVRSGLLMLYLSLFVLLLFYIYRSRRYAVATIALIALTSIPFLAYYSVPSFKAKIDYARWDMKMYMAGKGASYSDSERLISLEIGWEIAKDYYLFGIGSGDIKNEVKNRYAQDYPSIKHKLPHNQFLFTWASNGIIGLALFLYAFFYPLLYKGNYKHPIFLSIHVIIFFSFMMENTIETSMGVGIYCFFLLLGLKGFRDQELIKNARPLA